MSHELFAFTPITTLALSRRFARTVPVRTSKRPTFRFHERSSNRKCSPICTTVGGSSGNLSSVEVSSTSSTDLKAGNASNRRNGVSRENSSVSMKSPKLETPPKSRRGQRTAPKSSTSSKLRRSSRSASKPASPSIGSVSRTRTFRKPRRYRISLNRSMSCYVDEISSSVLLEQREVVKLSGDVRAGMDVENASKKLQAKLKRRPSNAELAEHLGQTVEDVQGARLRGTAAKNVLVSSNLRLVTSVCRRIRNQRIGGSIEKALGTGSVPIGLGLDDMIQEGSVGLIRAAEKYDASLGYKFSTYATWWIRAAVMRAITTQSRSIRVPSTVVDDYTRIKKEYERQRQLGDFNPTEESVACELGITTAKLRFVVSAVTRIPASLDIFVGGTGESGTKSTLGDIVEGDDRVEERMVEAMQHRELDRALKLALKPTERAAIRLRFGLDDGHSRTLREIGRILGLSKERVRQVTFRALGKLNKPEMRRLLQEYVE